MEGRGLCRPPFASFEESGNSKARFTKCERTFTVVSNRITKSPKQAPGSSSWNQDPPPTNLALLNTSSIEHEAERLMLLQTTAITSMTLPASSASQPCLVSFETRLTEILRAVSSLQRLTRLEAVWGRESVETRKTHSSSAESR